MFFQLISLNYLIYLAGFFTITFLYISAYFVASNWIYLCWLSVPVIRIISLQKFYTTDTDFFLLGLWQFVFLFVYMKNIAIFVNILASMGMYHLTCMKAASCECFSVGGHWSVSDLKKYVKYNNWKTKMNILYCHDKCI